MKRRILSGTLGIFIALMLSSTAYSQQKIDQFFGVLPPAAATHGFTKGVSVNTPLYEAFIKTTDAQATTEEIIAYGGIVKMAVGQILTASIPQAAIEKLASLEEVVYIEAAKPISPRNDLAMMDVNGNEVHEGIILSQAYTGANTVIGIIDTGIDYDHLDFKDDAGNNRILYIWDQGGESGAGPSELTNTYGTECDPQDITDGSCPVTDEIGHGTHVAATAAGRHAKYKGVAPDSSIIMVRYKSELEIADGYANPIFSTNICEAAYYVFKKAESLGLPAVVNLSLGTHIGPHDGTSLFEECLDSLVEGSSGRVIVAAVGNETSDDNYYTGLHTGFDVTSNLVKATNFRVRSFSAGRIVYIDVWQKQNSHISFGLALNEVSGNTHDLIAQSGMVLPGRSKSGHFLNGKIAYEINASETKSSLNGKPHVGITLVFRDDIQDPTDYSFDLIASGQGSFNAWLYPDKPADMVNFTSLNKKNGVSWQYEPGDKDMSIAVPATAKNVIAVAAYTTRNIWDCCQIDYQMGNILGFSSRGPTADPNYTGHKPEIAAPGAMIASAKSTHSPTDKNLIMSDGEHTLMAGTSMATPFVSGTAALLFSVNPNYTHEDIEQFIVESAYVDSYVANTPNHIWGYGKLDILGAIEVSFGRAPSGSTNQNITAPAASSSGKSGSCQLIGSPISPCNAAAIIFMAMLVVALVMARMVTVTRH